MSQEPEASASRARTPCPRCGSHESVLGTETSWYVYLRCPICWEVWASPDRRLLARRSLEVEPRASGAHDLT